MSDNRSQTRDPGKRERAIQAYDDARERAGDAFDQAPLIAVAGGIAAGALIAALLPRTRTEEKLLRPVTDRARETARAAARAAKDAGQTRMEELGLTKDKGRDTVRQIIDSARDAAKASADAALSTARGSDRS
jgi:hypothetical protein